MRPRLRNFTLSILIIALVIPSTVLLAPKKVEAGATDCLGGLIGGGIGGLVGGVSSVLSVPVGDAGNLTVNTTNSVNTGGSFVKTCIIEPLVSQMIKSIIHNFTAQTVRWINSGFKGSPLYVTNPAGFFSDVADQAIGQYIEGLGPLGQIVCGPFDLKLRLSLGIQYSATGYQQQVGCRLSDIQKNVDNFTKGSFGQKGWQNFVNISVTPQNNPYGAFIKATEAIDARIIGRNNIEAKQLDWGGGFLSSRDPKTGQVQTPGKLIEDQLATTFGSEIRQVELAKDLDAILNALVGQMINQVLGPGGLLGATQQNSSGGPSYVDRLASGSITNDLARQQTLSSLKLPTGILPAGLTEQQFCDAFAQNLYYTKVVNGKTVVYVRTGVLGKDSTTINNTPAIPTTKTTDGTAWTVDEYNTVGTFCKNLSITAPAKQSIDQFNGTGSAINDALTKAGIFNHDDPNANSGKPKNLALRKQTRQSSMYNGWGYSPVSDNAVDGQLSGNQYYGVALTRKINSEAYWQVDLGQSSQIGTVKIYRYVTGDWLNYPFYIFITTKDMGEMTLAQILADKSGAVTGTLLVNPNTAFVNGFNDATFHFGAVTGQYVRIAKNVSDTHLGLTEVEVYAPETGSGGGSAVTQTPIVFENNSTVIPIDQGSDLVDNKIKLTANTTLSNLRVQTYVIPTGSTNTGLLPSVFDSLDIVKTDMGKVATTYNTLIPNNSYRCGTSCPAQLNPNLKTIPGNPNGVILQQAQVRGQVEPNLSLKAGDTITFDIKGVIIPANKLVLPAGQYQLVLEIADLQGAVLTSHITRFEIKQQ